MANRYLSDDGRVNAAMVSPALRAGLKRLLACWVAAQMHWRDFTPAVAHLVACHRMTLALGGTLQVQGAGRVEPPCRDALTQALARPERQRFYDAKGELAAPAQLLQTMSLAIAPLLQDWLERGGIAREFEWAAQDQAGALLYDLHARHTLQGLGGCGTPEDFLLAS